MNAKSQIQSNNILPFTSVQTGILQRKCACGAHTVAGDKCDECQKGALQRKSSNNSKQSEVPPIVPEVLNSSGQLLDKTTRAFFEPRFAHDFSKVPVSSSSQKMSHSRLSIGESTDVYEQEADRITDSIMLKENHENKTSSTNEQQSDKFDLSHVRIHTDARAAESARAVNALAYTVGNNIVFGAGQFSPETHKGRRLIAHELVHVAQQSGNTAQLQRWSVPQFAAPDQSAERAAAVAEAEAIAGRTTEQVEAEAEAEMAFALNTRKRKDKNYAWSLGLKDKALIQKKRKLSPEHNYEVISKIRFFQGEAKTAYLQTISPALQDLAENEQVSAILAEFGSKRGQTQKSCDVSQNQFLLQYEGEPSKDRCIVKTDKEFKNDYFDNNIHRAIAFSMEGTTWENVESSRFKIMMVYYNGGLSEPFLLNELGNFYYGIIRGLLEHTYLKRTNGLIYPIFNGKIYFNDYLTPNIISFKAGMPDQIKELQEMYKLLELAGTFANNMGSYGSAGSPASPSRSSSPGYTRLKGSRSATTQTSMRLPATTRDTPATTQTASTAATPRTTSPTPREAAISFRAQYPKLDQGVDTLDGLEDMFRRSMSGKRTRTPRSGRYLPSHTGGAAGELNAIHETHNDPSVVQIRVVPQQRGAGAQRTPDLQVDVRMPDGSITTQPREIRAITGGRRGYQPVGSRQAVTASVNAIANSIRAKIFPSGKSSQLAGGGDLVIQVRRGGSNVDANIAAAVNSLNPRLAGARFLREIHFNLPNKRVVRYVRAPDGTFVAAP